MYIQDVVPAVALAAVLLFIHLLNKNMCIEAHEINKNQFAKPNSDLMN